MDKSPFLKPIGLACSIVGLVQSLIYIGLTLYGGLLYEGVIKTSFKPNSFSDELYQRYFKKANTDGSKILTPFVLNIYIWIYVAIYLFWICSSAYSMQVFNEKMNKKLRTSVYSWATIVYTLSLLDFVLTVLFGLDYNSINKEKEIVSLAAIFMMCMAARGFILWFCNVILASILMILTLKNATFDNDDLMDDNSDTISHISRHTNKEFGNDKNSIYENSPSSPHWHPPIDAFSYNSGDVTPTPPWENKPNVKNVPLKNPAAPHPGWTLRRDQGLNQWDIRRSPNHDSWDNRGYENPQMRNNHQMPNRNQSNDDQWAKRKQNNNGDNRNNRDNKNHPNQMSSFKPKEPQNKNNSPVTIPLPDYSPNLPRINRNALRPAMRTDSQFDRY